MKKSIAAFLLLLSVCLEDCHGFQSPPTRTVTKRRRHARLSNERGTINDNNNKESTDKEAFDDFLEKGILGNAVEYAKENPTMRLTKERCSRVFGAMEEYLKEEGLAAKQKALYVYTTLHESNHLKLFGAAKAPAAMLPETGIKPEAFVVQGSYGQLVAQILLLAVEVGLCLWFGWEAKQLAWWTFVAYAIDAVFVGGAIYGSYVRLFSPGIHEKIIRHEAGHFLCAYLLGCPVCGFVLGPWDALRDKRFRGTDLGATLCFDPILIEETKRSSISRSTLDRYSVIVMGGIAAEAIQYGQTNYGADDQGTLASFLVRNQNKFGGKDNDMPKTWNSSDQERWGILQAVLLLKEYKPCYDALVEALERGCNLGECIYAIEKAGLENELKPMDKPLGYIVDCGEYGEWTTEKPPALQMSRAVVDEGNEMAIGAIQEKKAKVTIDKNVSLATMKEVRQMMEEKIKAIDEKLLVLEQDSP